MARNPMSRNVGSVSPAQVYVAVTPHDSTNLTVEARGLYIGTTGHVVAVDRQGNAVTFTSVPSGYILPIFCTRVNATGTTATNIVALI